MKNKRLCNLFILSLFLGFPLSFSVASAESLDNQKHQQSHHNINGIQLAIDGPVDSVYLKKGHGPVILKPRINKKEIMENKTTTFKARPAFNKIPLRNNGRVITDYQQKK